MIKSSRTLAEITVVGTDQKGVVAQVTNFIFKAQGNIEKINQIELDKEFAYISCTVKEELLKN